MSRERWHTLSLCEQMGNIGSEVGRAGKWFGKDTARYESAKTRALELIQLTIDDPRWRGRLKELTRARSVFHDACFGGIEFESTFSDVEKYFMQFALAARRRR